MAKKKKSTKRIGRRSRGMSKGTKTLLVVGAAAGAGYLLYKAMQKPPEGEPTPEGPGGQITLQIIPAGGGGVGRGGIGGITPIPLQAPSIGNQWLMTITNTSRYTATPTVGVPYDFGIACWMFKGTVVPTDLSTNVLFVAQFQGAGTSLFSVGPSQHFDAGQTRTISFPNGFNLDASYTGPAVAYAELHPADGSGVAIAKSSAVALTIVAGGITPGGTITW